LAIEYPKKFLDIRVQNLNVNPAMTALCAGYELKNWRARGFAKSIFSWLPYAALSQDDQSAFGIHNWEEFVNRAALHVYTKKDDLTRGEVGEILLHQACVQYYGASPVICKLILKTSPNDVIKGYDGVYICPNAENDDFEIWLGEAKFYTNQNDAAIAAVKSIKEHFLPDFIKAEKAMIVGHINKNVPFYSKISDLFHGTTSADELFGRAVFPVLITYESAAIANHNIVGPSLTVALEAEVESIARKFDSIISTHGLRIQLILIPLGSKSQLLHEFDSRLQAHL
jgi:hypothetical protein